MQKTINHTSNGHLFKCSSCEKIHIEFFHFLFAFSKEEYDHFRRCVLGINGAYYEHHNARLNFKRKIMVPVGHRNITMLLNNKDLSELKQLLILEHNDDEIEYFLSCTDIGVKLSSN